ncbi:MAG: hypothetical protein ABFS03_00860 [Chloroflexota bacterium]
MRANNRILNARHRELRARQTENGALTYTINYAAELDTDTISTSTWSSEDSGLTIANESIEGQGVSGTSTIKITNGLIDYMAEFITSGVEIGDTAKNKDTGATALVTSLLSDNYITLDSDIFTLGDSYLIFSSNTLAKARLSGDTGRYRIVNKVITTNGDSIERYIDLSIVDNSKYYYPDYLFGWRW